MDEPTLNTTPNPATSDPAPNGQDAPSPEQATVANWLREDFNAGKMTADQFAEAMQELTGQEDTQGLDMRTPEQKDYDASFPPARAEDFNFPFPEHGVSMTADMKAADTMARGWLATGLFTKEHGSALAVEVDRVARKIEHFTPAEHELFARSERLVLEKVWGADTQKNLSIAKAFVREVAEKHPQIIDFLDQTGLGNSSGVIIGLYHQAERLAARNGESL
ncbi:MAG TPA: hypothetical protein PK224_03915 [Nitrospira sp.]|nr:hypothetical protein [Nitrospira sp.]